MGGMGIIRLFLGGRNGAIMKIIMEILMRMGMLMAKVMGLIEVIREMFEFIY